MAGPGTLYLATSSPDWTGLVSPTILTPHDFSETFDVVGWDGTDVYALAYQLTPDTSGMITVDMWLSSYAGHSAEAGSTHPFDGSQLIGQVSIISGSVYFIGGHSMGGIDGQCDSITIRCTAGTPIKLYAFVDVEDADFSDIANLAVHARLRTGDIVPESSTFPGPETWSPAISWPAGSDPPRTVVESSLPGRRHFRPR